MGASILSVLAIVGVALTYWYLQQKIDNQKRQTRKVFEELQSNHEAQMQEAVNFLQEDYQTRLTQATEELKKQLESQLQEAIKSLQETYQPQPIQTIEELKEYPESQLQEWQPLQETYQPQPTQMTEDLTETQDLWFPETDNFLEEHSQNQLQEVTQSLEDNVGAPENAAKDERQEEVLIPSSLETEPQPIETSFVDTSSVGDWTTVQSLSDTTTPENEAKDEEQAEVLIHSSLETQPTPSESSLDGISSDSSKATAQSLSGTTSKKAKDLGKEIIALGDSGQVASIPKLTEYVNHPDSRIRELVASALGTIAASQGIKAEIQRAIPILGKLSRDSEALVRQSAVEALGKIKSETVIPLLSLALRDSDSHVVKVASAALNKFKFYPMNQGTKPAKTSAKPKP